MSTRRQLSAATQSAGFTLIALLTALPATVAASPPDGLSNTMFVGERHARLERIEPDPWTLRSGGSGSLLVWTITELMTTDVDGPLRLPAVRLVSEGPGGRRELLLSGVTLRPASAGAETGEAAASSTAPQRGFGSWEVSFQRILVSSPPHRGSRTAARKDLPVGEPPAGGGDPDDPVIQEPVIQGPAIQGPAIQGRVPDPGVGHDRTETVGSNRSTPVGAGRKPAAGPTVGEPASGSRRPGQGSSPSTAGPPALTPITDGSSNTLMVAGDIPISDLVSFGIRRDGGRGRVVWTRLQLVRGLPNRLARGESQRAGKMTLEVGEPAARSADGDYVLTRLEHAASDGRPIPELGLRTRGGDTIFLQGVRVLGIERGTTTLIILEYIKIA